MSHFTKFRRGAALLAAMMSMGAVPLALAETVLITGANSGLGLEFAKQYAAKLAEQERPKPRPSKTLRAA